MYTEITTSTLNSNSHGINGQQICSLLLTQVFVYNNFNFIDCNFFSLLLFCIVMFSSMIMTRQWWYQIMTRRKRKMGTTYVWVFSATSWWGWVKLAEKPRMRRHLGYLWVETRAGNNGLRADINKSSHRSNPFRRQSQTRIAAILGKGCRRQPTVFWKLTIKTQRTYFVRGKKKHGWMDGWRREGVSSGWIYVWMHTLFPIFLLSARSATKVLVSFTAAFKSNISSRGFGG